MKFRWTLSFAALASIAGILPALAQQGSSLPPLKNTERQKNDRKIDAAAMTPFMTKRQADTLKGIEKKGDERSNDEQVAYPQNQGTALPQSAGQMVAGQAGAQGAPADPNAEPGKEAPAKEPPREPTYRLMGTVCGKGKDIAMFDRGGELPAMLKEGDMLDPMTKVVSVSRGKVKLERTEVYLVPAPTVKSAEPADPANPDNPEKPAAPPIRKEKKELYELYAW